MDAMETIQSPPSFCEYCSGPCDQSFDKICRNRGIFLYSSEPAMIASTIEAAVKLLQTGQGDARWIRWKDLKIAGQIVFCSICKAIRFSDYILADVTTLNFNVLFEIGVALGLGKPLILLRDATFLKDKRSFDELGILDTFGYTDFQNSEQLATKIQQALPVSALSPSAGSINFEAPLYVLKGPLETEGEVLLISTLKRSAVRFRAYDSTETPRLSLHEVRKQVNSSLAMIAHLINKDRKGSEIHNARCALASGLAMATGKAVLMLQEGHVPQPIDYRDIVRSYADPNHVPGLAEVIIRRTIQRLQSQQVRQAVPPEGLLEKLDIGDTAAENESRPLKFYFLKTAQYQQAKQGHARLVVGRKGSGKSAIFYAYRESFGHSYSRLVLDLKPEGHQFTRLRETILEKLAPGLQEHTMTAFWNAILLAELAHKIREEEESWAKWDPERRKKFDDVATVYARCGFAERGDFSERLLNQVNRIADDYARLTGEPTAKQLTELLYKGDIRSLDDAIAAYLADKDEVALIVDNLDKGWPTRGASAIDILIIRTLLEATRKLQRQLEARNVSFHCLVFLRNDIFELLVKETSDKGKDTAITLDWADKELFKELFRLRVIASGLLKGTFEDTWNTIFERYVDTSDSFQFVVERTLMRPRDFLAFLHRAIEVAINRGHDQVLAADFKQAEKKYSEDMLQMASYELKDVAAVVPDLFYAFLGCPVQLQREQAKSLLKDVGVKDTDLDGILKLLTWYGFLGVQTSKNERPRFAYEIGYDLIKLLAPLEKGAGWFAIHPAYRPALECSGSD